MSSQSGTESHTETIISEIRPKQIKLQERYATTVTTDIKPQFQPIDLTFEVPIPPQFLTTLKNIQSQEGVRVTFEGFIQGNFHYTFFKLASNIYYRIGSFLNSF